MDPFVVMDLAVSFDGSRLCDVVRGGVEGAVEAVRDSGRIVGLVLVERVKD